MWNYENNIKCFPQFWSYQQKEKKKQKKEKLHLLILFLLYCHTLYKFFFCPKNGESLTMSGIFIKTKSTISKMGDNGINYLIDA